MSGVNVPVEVGYGTVTASVMSFWADGSNLLPDGVPDQVPVEGRIILTPTVASLRFPDLDDPIITPLARIECPLIGGGCTHH